MEDVLDLDYDEGSNPPPEKGDEVEEGEEVDTADGREEGERTEEGEEVSALFLLFYSQNAE